MKQIIVIITIRNYIFVSATSLYYFLYFYLFAVVTLELTPVVVELASKIESHFEINWIIIIIMKGIIIIIICIECCVTKDRVRIG